MNLPIYILSWTDEHADHPFQQAAFLYKRSAEQHATKIGIAQMPVHSKMKITPYRLKSAHDVVNLLNKLLTCENKPEESNDMITIHPDTLTEVVDPQTIGRVEREASVPDVIEIWSESKLPNKDAAVAITRALQKPQVCPFKVGEIVAYVNDHPSHSWGNGDYKITRIVGSEVFMDKVLPDGSTQWSGDVVNWVDNPYIQKKGGRHV